jgi:hypothetical protein
MAIALAIFCHPVLASDAPTTTAENVRAQTIRIGHFPNITHAQALIAHQLSRSGDGWFEKRLGHEVNIQWYVYNAGPASLGDGQDRVTVRGWRSAVCPVP